MVPVALGPTAPGTARGEALQPGPTVKRLGLAVDPTPTEGLVQGLSMGDGPGATAFLVELDPEPRRAVVMLSQPGAPDLRRGKGADVAGLCSAHAMFFQRVSPSAAPARRPRKPVSRRQARCARPRMLSEEVRRIAAAASNRTPSPAPNPNPARARSSHRAKPAR